MACRTFGGETEGVISERGAPSFDVASFRHEPIDLSSAITLDNQIEWLVFAL